MKHVNFLTIDLFFTGLFPDCTFEKEAFLYSSSMIRTSTVVSTYSMIVE